MNKIRHVKPMKLHFKYFGKEKIPIIYIKKLFYHLINLLLKKYTLLKSTNIKFVCINM